jgi:pimeloyl-ACP methyl ester carboxylesterase
MTREVQAVIRENAVRVESIRALFVMEPTISCSDAMRGGALSRHDTQVEFLPGAGHVCYIKQPEAFNKIAFAFLAAT